MSDTTLDGVAHGFGATLHEARSKYGWTVDETAARLSISPRQVLRYEKAQAQPTLPVVIRLADVLGISLDEVVGRERRRQQPLAIELDVDGVKYRAVRLPRGG